MNETIQFQTVFEQSHSPFLLLNPELIIVGVNEAYLAVTKTKRKDIVGQKIFEVFPDHTLRLAHNNLQHAQNVLNEAHFELKQFVQMNPVPMVVWRSKDHVYTVVNDAHDKLLGKSVLGKTIRGAHTIEEAKDVPAILDQIFKTDKSFISKEKSYSVTGVDGLLRSIWINEWFCPFHNQSGEVVGILGTAQDVTEQVMARQTINEKKIELEHSILELEKERGAREQFVAMLTHDMRTPLAAAKLTSQMLARKADNPDIVRKLAAKLDESIERADRMIRDLLDANRIKAGEALSLNISQCELSKIVQDTLDDLGTIYGDRFNFEKPSDLILGFWSEDGLKRILENLCNNAIKYGNKEKILVKISVTELRVFLLVTNQGPAISKYDQDSLFELYRRTPIAHKGKAKGWGLGLTLVRGLTESHKGTVNVESSVDKGTTFTVDLPLDSRI